MSDTEDVFACEEDDCAEHVYSYELCTTQDGREVCRDCFESGYDDEGYPIAEQIQGGAR